MRRTVDQYPGVGPTWTICTRPPGKPQIWTRQSWLLGSLIKDDRAYRERIQIVAAEVKVLSPCSPSRTRSAWPRVRFLHVSRPPSRKLSAVGAKAVSLRGLMTRMEAPLSPLPVWLVHTRQQKAPCSWEGGVPTQLVTKETSAVGG